ncbi:Lrp/AsnC family transcriptional regulator [Maridesulfovibrio sp.]|jgi:Lrp/AsnC family leucine-responsive transcriptional regulator|uniref:Lrp/AsnC family transcriptional regulator n=1 Tax=Maridesulfovibrio sp. TaxID=2795000 RepID=UPI0029C9D7FA|nr:Lrp/AsnC family transcriptional regulator [Maridesulfovibrio sp.]
MSKRKIDETDRKILTILQNSGRVSNADIARKVGMAPSAVLERVRKLERKGVLTGYEAIVDPKAVGRSLTAFIFVNVNEGVGATSTGEELSRVPGVLEVHYCAGRDSYLIKVRCEDTDGLAIMLGQIGRIETVRDTNSTIVLNTIRESRAIPLEEEEYYES